MKLTNLVPERWAGIVHTQLMAGSDPLSIKDALGHSGLEMTMRYSHLNNSHRAEMADKLEQSISTNLAHSL